MVKKKSKEKVIELENQLKRALADYDNLRKRFEKERLEVVRFANEILLAKILAIVDGLELVVNQFKDLLKTEGFCEIEVKIGDKFNPQVMEGVSTENPERMGTVKDSEKVVTEILQKGYKLHNKVIRAVRVKVGSKKSEIQNPKF